MGVTNWKLLDLLAMMGEKAVDEQPVVCFLAVLAVFAFLAFSAMAFRHGNLIRRDRNRVRRELLRTIRALSSDGQEVIRGSSLWNRILGRRW